MILLYRLVHNDIGINLPDYFCTSLFTLLEDTVLNYLNPMLSKIQFFAVRIVDTWNSLPEFVVEAQSLNAFTYLF